MNELQFIDDRTLRDSRISHIEVLERVKSLLLIPETEFATAKQVAEFYEVDPKVIEHIYTRHLDELTSDGMCFKKYKEISFLHCGGMKTAKGKVTFTFEDGTTFDFPTKGLKVFPRRAILRIGMLLRDSAVAKEVRTQLLNIEEKSSMETKTEDIDEELRLINNVGRAYASGDNDELIKATTEYNAFQKRHIRKLENDNKALAGNILEWKDRNRLNAGVRKLASVRRVYFGNIWNELYKNLQYKYGICLKQRGNKPYLQWVKESEWGNVIKTFCAMCEAYGQSPTEMFQQTTPINSLKVAT